MAIMLSATADNDRRPRWQTIATHSTCPAFERTSKRRKGYPSETRVKRGLRIVHGDKELIEKLGLRGDNYDGRLSGNYDGR